MADGWYDRAVESWRAVLRPLSSRGRWAGREPFGAPTRQQAWAGPVAAITRARLSPRRALGFWRSVRPVSRRWTARPGLLASFGFGEAPLGYQGTFSVWSEQAALQQFAYRGRTRRHRPVGPVAVVRRGAVRPVRRSGRIRHD